MSAGRYTRILSDAEIERIYRGAVRVLCETGFRIQHEGILARLERRGAKVDHVGQVFWSTDEMIRQLEECARRHAAPLPAETVLRRPLPAGERLGYNGTLFYDWATGVQRMATLQDVRNVLKACHMLPEVVALGPMMTAQDVPAPVEPIASLAEAIGHSDKEITGVELILGEQLPFLEELYTIVRGRQFRYTSDGAAIGRFTLDARAARCVTAVSERHGLESWVTSSCPVAGASAPVTLAGAVVVAVAETLGSWFAGWALNDDVALGAIPCAGIMDMRTTRVLFSAPEAVLIDAGLFQVLERVLGVQAGMLADYTDAKVPGMQAMNDKVFKSLAYAWLTGRPGWRQRGMLEAGKAFSPTQLIIDLEINRELDQLAHGMEVSDETLALEEIEAYGLDLSKSYLDAKHTLRHFHDALWHPRLMDRTTWESAEAERKKEHRMLRLAEARWRDALARYEQPAIPGEVIRAMDDVVDRARHALL